MKSEKLPVSSNRRAINAEDERARLRRNQRNSRARKQAYVQELEERWNECVRLGVQATVEMQREARRVQAENRLLRGLLHKQGLDDVAIEEALVVLTGSEGNKGQPSVFHHSLEHPAQTGVAPAALSAQNSFNELQPTAQGLPDALTFDGNTVPLGAPADISQELNIDDWFTDLCSIKDAFANDVLVADQLLQCSMTLPDISPHFAVNSTQSDQPLSEQDDIISIDLLQESGCTSLDWENMYDTQTHR
ncbi:hypothetical protein F5Y12DRAFT_363081 [Xylaria sp. FL1777]|nr:hypothetical protein F5Y12DRAFT_363081 [Xylaria sp. FL1777]